MNGSRIRCAVAGLAAAGLLPALAAAQTAQPENGPDFYAGETALREYVAAALEHNPGVLEARARYRASRQRVPQVTALPDPVVSFTQALRSVETRVGPQLNSVTLSQAFPWFGTLALRGRVALLEATALHHLYEAARRDVVAQVKETFYDLGYVDAALGLAREERSLLDHYETVARARYATGQGLQQAVLRLQAELARVLNREHQLDRQRGTSAARLNYLRDRPVAEAVPGVPPLARPDVDFDRERLHHLGERNRQELLAASALVEGGEGAVDLAQRNGRPNFTASVGVTNVGRRGDPAGLSLPPPDDGRNAITVSLGVSLPLWGARYRAGIEQAASDLEARLHHRAAARNAMEVAVEEAVVHLETLDRQIDLLDTVLVPQTEEALRATEAAYETGQLGVLDLLDSGRTLIDIRLLRARYVSDYLIAFTALERAIGTRVPANGRLP